MRFVVISQRGVNYAPCIRTCPYPMQKKMTSKDINTAQLRERTCASAMNNTRISNMLSLFSWITQLLTIFFFHSHLCTLAIFLRLRGFFFTSRNVVKIMENIDIMSLSFSFQYLLMRNNSQFCPLQFLFSSFHFSSSFFKSRDSLCLFSNIGCLYEFKCGSTWDTYFMS